MFIHETFPFRIFALFLFVILSAGCAITKPSLNSFQATIQVSEWDFKADRSGEFYEMEDECQPTSVKEKNAFVLIHGIYGDEDTFDRLQDELTFDPDLAKLGPSSVYLMEYWSSQFFPNFQSLSELGQAFKQRIEELVECKDPQELIIIAHSQGGLIAKEAVLAWKEIDDEKSKDILEKIKLILIGTPNSFSTYAAYNNLIVNSLFAPITWVTGLFTAPFGKAFVYNRQAFDMADNIFPAGSGDRPGLFRSRFMLNHIAKWGEYFPSGVMDRDKPKTYAIVGVKNLFDHYDLSDGVVHSTTLLLGGIPANRVHHVPYRHFGGEAAVDDEHHRTFKAILNMVLGKSDEAKTTSNVDTSAQKLSPYEDLPYSIITFVMEKSHSNIQLESVRIEAEKPPMSEDERDAGLEKSKNEPVIDIDYYKRQLKEVKRRLNQDASIDIATTIGEILAFPFQLLQSLMYPVVNMAETHAQDFEASKWEIEHIPITVLDGEHEGLIEIRNNEKSSFFGMIGAEDGSAHYRITDDPSDEKGEEKPECKVSYPIIWESSTNSSLTSAKKPPGKIIIKRNAVNYIKVELNDKEITLTRVGCV